MLSKLVLIMSVLGAVDLQHVFMTTVISCLDSSPSHGNLYKYSVLQDASLPHLKLLPCNVCKIRITNVIKMMLSRRLQDDMFNERCSYFYS